MTGGMAIVEALIANGVDTVFGLPGAQLYPLFDALQQRSDRIRTIGARHEQACGYMAFGYARSTGRPGVYRRRAGARHAQHVGCAVHRVRLLRAVLCITGRCPRRFSGADAATCTSCPISSPPCAR